MKKVELDNKMAVLLGGRAAEHVVFNEISTGAADDLVRATDLARAMVLRYGMSEALGNVAYDRERMPYLRPEVPLPQNREYSEETAKAVDYAVRQLVDGALDKAIAILKANRALLDRTAEELLKTETLNPPQIEALKRELAPGRMMPAA